MKTNLKLAAVIVTAMVATLIPRLAVAGTEPLNTSDVTYVNQLIKCHEAKFEFDDAVGQLNKHFTADTVYAYSGFIHTGVPTQINPNAKTVAIKAPFEASAPTFVTDSHGVLWACATLNKR